MKIFTLDYTSRGSKEIPNELNQGLDPHAYIKRGHTGYVDVCCAGSEKLMKFSIGLFILWFNVLSEIYIKFYTIALKTLQYITYRAILYNLLGPITCDNRLNKRRITGRLFRVLTLI